VTFFESDAGVGKAGRGVAFGRRPLDLVPESCQVLSTPLPVPTIFMASSSVAVPPTLADNSRRFTIKVPATSANIGPGFDVCGISLSLSLTLDVTVAGADAPSLPPTPGGSRVPLELIYTGEGADEVPLDPYKNLMTRIALYVLRSHGVRSFPPHVRVAVHNEIPFGRGLGSSGAAVVAGVLLGDALGALGLTPSRLLDFALMVERHPDNVTAALVGGFVGSYLRELPPIEEAAARVPLSEVLPEYPPDAGEDWGLDPPQPPLGIGHFVRFGWSPDIKAVAIIPRFELSTAKARGVLPQEYSRKDLVRALCLVVLFLEHVELTKNKKKLFDRCSISNASPSLPLHWVNHHRTRTSSMKR
jgi:homoserine kinase